MVINIPSFFVQKQVFLYARQGCVRRRKLWQNLSCTPTSDVDDHGDTSGERIPIKVSGPDNRFTMVMIVNKLLMSGAVVGLSAAAAAYWMSTVKMQNVPAVLDIAPVMALYLLKSHRPI
jgi:hypothetical protein